MTPKHIHKHTKHSHEKIEIVVKYSMPCEIITAVRIHHENPSQHLYTGHDTHNMLNIFALYYDHLRHLDTHNLVHPHV